MNDADWNTQCAGNGFDGQLCSASSKTSNKAGQIRRISPETMSLDLDFFLISRKNRRDTSTMEVFRLAINETMS